jgi:hypothetical protein
MRKNQYVVPHDKGWAVKSEGSTKATKVFTTKDKAVEFGKAVAKNQASELTILKQNGQIQDKSSYGNDPYPPKG